VFTNEDLARTKILDEAPRSESSGASIATPLPAVAPVAPTEVLAARPNSTPVPVWMPSTPLGDVARYYRQRKELLTPPLPQQWQPSEEPVVAYVSGPAPLAPAPAPPAADSVPQQPALKPKRIIANTNLPPAVVKDPELQATAVARVVRVNSGDSLWKIAGRHLGDPNQWRQIAAANPEIADPNRIRAGQELRLPSIESTFVAKNEIGDQIQVQRGDSLWKLAKTQFGDGQAWSCIAESNPQIGAAGRIFPGQILTLPSLCS
jgi:nucleoid-associated protein YgaU